jgi:hypothetical protein
VGFRDDMEEIRRGRVGGDHIERCLSAHSSVGY